jgi:hypothetical protein
MARLCTVCTNARRAEIDRALVKGATERALATEFGLSKGAIHRHKLQCAGLAPVGTKKVREAQREISQGTVALALLPTRDQLGSRYEMLGERIDAIISAAQKAGSLAVAVQGLNSLRQNWDSLAKLAGHVGGAPQVNVGVQVNLSAGEIAAELAKALSGADAKVIEAVLDDD